MTYYSTVYVNNNNSNDSNNSNNDDSLIILNLCKLLEIELSNENIFVRLETV